MDGTEAPLAEGGGARGHRDEDQAPAARPAAASEGRARARASSPASRALAVALEGQQACANSAR